MNRRLKLPIFYIGGEDDPVIGNKQQFQQSQKYMRSYGYTNIKSKLYKHLRHEILNEKEKQTVFADVAAFLENKGF